MDGTSNWWGASDGPSGTWPGSGDAVTANVDPNGFETAGPDACVDCVADTDCEDGVACNGAETCNVGTGMCSAGTAVTCAGQCETGTCLEPSGACEPVTCRLTAPESLFLRAG